jgi:putative tryptophan/tyrosine transport system substrate-binding protein
MRRRQFIALLALTAGAWPLASRAQTGIKRVGVVYQGGPYEASIEGLREGLKAAGLEEGRHFALLVRNVRGDAVAAEAAARALERDDKVDVIVAFSTTAARPPSWPPQMSRSCSRPETTRSRWDWSTASRRRADG